MSDKPNLKVERVNALYDRWSKLGFVGSQSAFTHFFGTITDLALPGRRFTRDSVINALDRAITFAENQKL